MTYDEFKERFGREPENDDLDRVNCKHVGTLGHWFCGVCETHNLPRFECGCMIDNRTYKEETSCP